MNHLLIHGNALRMPLADQSVHCVVTSPPYWGLRDYGTAAWEGGDEGCDHAPPHREFGEKRSSTLAGGHGVISIQEQGTAAYRDLCGKCGARRIDQQLGLEATPDQYISTMVQVFREVRRVMRDDATCWCNLGDSYAAGGKGGGGSYMDERGDAAWKGRSVVNGWRPPPPGLKPKDLCGIPWRLALALQADGWYLRSDIIWSKPNPMPESVTDRPTKSHEYLFLLTKNERYFYDCEAIREPMAEASEGRYGYAFGGEKSEQLVEANKNGIGVRTRPIGIREPTSGRNKRSVWQVPTESFPGAHFATFPRKLVEPCIKAGTSERGCCPQCGAGWERETDTPDWYKALPGHKAPSGDLRSGVNVGFGSKKDSLSKPSFTTGWHPGCDCFSDRVPEPKSAPCTVFDPFAGSGTTGVVALAHGRRFIGLDLSAEYLGLATKRITRPHQRVPRPGKVEHHPLFDGASQ